MEKYFCNYNQSLALKELGFNGSCFGGWNHPFDNQGPHLQLNQECEYDIKAPLKSQVFEFFRKEYGLWFRPDFYDEMKTYDYQGSVHKLGRFSSIASLDNYKTVEELESACINKLIELVKKK